MIKAEDFKWLDRVYHLFHLGSYLCLSGALTDCFLPMAKSSQLMPLINTGNLIVTICKMLTLLDLLTGPDWIHRVTGLYGNLDLGMCFLPCIT